MKGGAVTSARSPFTVPRWARKSRSWERLLARLDMEVRNVHMMAELDAKCMDRCVS